MYTKLVTFDWNDTMTDNNILDNSTLVSYTNGMLSAFLVPWCGLEVFDPGTCHPMQKCYFLVDVLLKTCNMFSLILFIKPTQFSNGVQLLSLLKMQWQPMSCTHGKGKEMGDLWTRPLQVESYWMEV